MTLSATDILRLRSGHHTTRLTVNAVPLTIVATAQVNQSSFTYPLVELTVDNTSTDWLTEGAKVGRMVLIGTAPGLWDVSVGIIRKAATTTKLFLDPKYAGEPGVPRNIAQAIANDYYVSIVKFRPAWGVMSSIRKGKFYKFWDTVYSDQGKNPTPIIRLGAHQQANVDPTTGKARFTINADVFYFGGRSYQSHSWGLDGQTQVSADADTLVVDCEPGCHEITYTVTDTKGKSATAYRYLFANHVTQFPALSDTYRLRNANCQQDRQGLTMNLTFDTPLDVDAVYPGQLFLATETATWGGETLDDMDAVAHSYVGYTAEARTRTAKHQRTTSITFYSPVSIAGKIRVEKQAIQEKKTPGTWTQVTKLLSNPVGAFYYLTRWQAPYLIDGHDFTFDTDLLLLRRKVHELNRTEALGDHLLQLADYLNGQGNIGSRTDGTTKMLRNPLYMNNTERNALPTFWTWQAGDIRGEVEHDLRWRFQVGKSFAGAFAHNGSSETVAYKAVAPGFIASQAPGETSLEDTTVPFSALVKERVLEISGYHHARENAETVPGATLGDRNLDVAQPCDLDGWHVWNIAASYDPIGQGWVNQRRLPLSVSRNWTGPRTARKAITVDEWEVETFGYPGQLVPINKGGANIWKVRPIPEYFNPYRPITPQLDATTPVMTAWSEYLQLGRTLTFNTPQVAWRPVRGLVVDAAINTESAYFSDPADPLQLLVLVYDDDAASLTLYSIADLINDPTSETLVKAWPSVDPAESFRFHARILVDPVLADFWVVAWKNVNGVTLDRTEDAGSTWEASPLVIGSSTDEPDNIEDPLGIDIRNGLQVVVAKENATPDAEGNLVYSVYYASSASGSFSKITNPTGWAVVPSALAFVNQSPATVLVPMFSLDSPEPDNPLEPITFQTSLGGDDYPDYTVTYSGSTGGVNCISSTCTAYSNKGGTTGHTLTVRADLTALYTFGDVSFEIDSTGGDGGTGRRTIVTVTLLDLSLNTIAEKSETFEGEWLSGSYAFSMTNADMGLSGDEQVWYVSVSVRMEWGNTVGSNHSIFIDNVDITAELIEFEGNRAMFTLAPATSTYTERNSQQLLPFNSYGIAESRAADDLVSMIARDEDGNNPTLLTSTNNGQTWVKRREVPGFVGCKRSGDVMILWGYNRLELSVDAGLTSYDQLGDWSTRVGPVGLIRGVAGVFS